MKLNIFKNIVVIFWTYKKNLRISYKKMYNINILKRANKIFM